MGTYTANKNLYMPSVGETGWGTLMNGNLETIDTFLKPISLSGSTYTFNGAKITSTSINGVAIKSNGVYTVTPTNTVFIADIYNNGLGHIDRTPEILPFNLTGYTGKLKFTNTNTQYDTGLYYTHDKMGQSNVISVTIPKSSTYELTFTNIHFLRINSSSSGTVNLYGFTIT